MPTSLRAGKAAATLWTFLVLFSGEPAGDACADDAPAAAVSSAAEAALSAQSEPQPAGPSPAGAQSGGERRITGGIFERRARNIHLFLGLEGRFTDNVYNTREDRKADYLTVVSPGISFSLPAVKEGWRAAGIETSSITPGGAAVTRFITRYPRLLQAALVYRADLERYARQTSENMTSHLAEGFVQYNFRGGLSLDVQDQFMRGRNQPGTGIFFRLDRFSSNYFGASASYEMGDRALLRLDYSNYTIHYADARNDFRDRADNGASAFLFYKVTRRTALFAQYEFMDVSYDEAVLKDSRLHNGYVGVRWDITAKTRGAVKVGYGVRHADQGGLPGRKNLLMEAQVDYFITPKTSVKLVASRRPNETDVSVTDFIVSESLRVTYAQRFTPKISGSAFLGYRRDRYNGDLTLGGETGRLVDRYYEGGLAVQYAMKEWLRFDLGCQRYQRASSFGDFDYRNNIVYFKVGSFI